MSSTLVEPYTGGDRFATITSSDHGGILWVASILCAIYSVLSFGLRLYVKRSVFGLDDVLAAVATITAQGQFIAIFCGLSAGLGRTYSSSRDHEIEAIGRSVLVSQVLFILALGFAKMSTALLIRRLFGPNMHVHVKTCDALIVVCAVWIAGSSAGIAINCPPSRVMGLKQTFCNDLVGRWKAVGATDIITELIIVGLSVMVVWKAQMNYRRKLQVVMAFVPRLGLVVLAGLHTHRIATQIASSDIGVAFVAPLTNQQIELCYSLVSCTIPNLRGFIIQFSTGMGFAGMSGYTTPGESTRVESFRLGTMKSKDWNMSQNKAPSSVDLNLDRFDESVNAQNSQRPGGWEANRRPSSSQENILDT